MGHFSSFLFARPSFSEGIGRLVDFGGTLDEYNRSLSGQQADAIAAWADWTAIGNDMRLALIREYRKSYRLMQQKQNVEGRGLAFGGNGMSPLPMDRAPVRGFPFHGIPSMLGQLGEPNLAVRDSPRWRL